MSSKFGNLKSLPISALKKLVYNLRDNIPYSINSLVFDATDDDEEDEEDVADNDDDDYNSDDLNNDDDDDDDMYYEVMNDNDNDNADYDEVGNDDNVSNGDDDKVNDDHNEVGENGDNDDDEVELQPVVSTSNSRSVFAKLFPSENHKGTVKGFLMPVKKTVTIFPTDIPRLKQPEVLNGKESLISYVKSHQDAANNKKNVWCFLYIRVISFERLIKISFKLTDYNVPFIAFGMQA